MSGWRARAAIGVALLAVIAAVVPIALLERSVERVRACFSAVEERGAPAGCGDRARWLPLLSRVPWTARYAELAREELEARDAVLRYFDAAVGAPDRDELGRRYAALASLRRDIEAGSSRLRLDLLGPPLGVFDASVYAEQAGDRRRLLESADRIASHDVAQAALDAALLEADLERAVELARRYVHLPSAALRLRAAALLCAGGAPALGLEAASAVARERADERKANIVTPFGSARVVVEACAALSERRAPELPTYGELDQRARLVALRVRRAAPENEVLDLARTASGRPLRFRLELVTAIAPLLEPNELRELGRPREGEPTPAERIPELVDEVVDPDADRPYLTPESWEEAAERVGENELVAAMRAHAALGHALAGRPDRAAELAESLPRPLSVRIGAMAALLGGDRNEARRRIEAAKERDAASELLLAELRLPDRAAAKRAAGAALAAAERRGRVLLGERARWLLVALGEKVSEAATKPRVRTVGPARDAAATRARDLDELFANWQGWLAAPAEQQRAIRWTVFRHRGDAPDALGAYLFAAGQLVEPARVEPWLDASLAQDVRRFSVRRVALARWRAAAWRADGAAAKLWRDRFLELAASAAATATAELMQASGL